MAVALTDQYNLANDPTFISRVRVAMLQTAIAIGFEALTVANHSQRSNYAVQCITSPVQQATNITNTVATDTNVINDATANGTVVITPANAATQAALVTDAHIQSAVTGQWQCFVTS